IHAQILPPASAIPFEDWLLRPDRFKAAAHREDSNRQLSLENGLVRRTFRLAPNAATVAFDNLMTGASVLRAVKPEALVTVDGKEYPVGGLKGQPDLAYLLPEWIGSLTNDPAAFQFQGVQIGKPRAPFAWKQPRHHANLPWPTPGVAATFHYAGVQPETRGLEVAVEYELYDGLPVLGKWLTVSNGTDRAVTVDSFTSELLAAVESDSAVNGREAKAWMPPAIDVLSDYAFNGMDAASASRASSWQEDTNYTTQVSYELKTPCLLVCRPLNGPAARLEPGQVFHSFRCFEVVHDSTERERQGLALRRAQRTLAPWTTENPVMMHVRGSDTKTFRNAVDQCVAVGFEMIIYTFGSGINMENEQPDYVARIKADVDYAHSKGIEVGAYSLFSSRRIDDANDVISPRTGKPGDAIFGTAPCFGSTWGTNYYHKLTNFMAQTGLDLLEHDGPYPGDSCASTNHPGHHGLADSQWVQWRMSTDLYSWCRERGIYVNQPDYYFLSGATKTAMGYRESNWSLPRAQQFIHARQNIYDGTWTKSPTMGWMFVPLTEYQGGGAAATIEPLREHLPDYESHLANTLGAGVQACWRGPRLYDADETRDLVKRWVDFFKQNRDILESDLIHLRRADGRDWDGWLHVNPRLETRGLAMIYNPLPTELRREIRLPLYYTGLRGKAKVAVGDAAPKTVALNDRQEAAVTVTIPAHSQVAVKIGPDGAKK
ncbi:MAG TPA: alpha-galactosidase, partial [Verrucomicrobiae bacterium]|nr:alpha-galactosidase [Verrucomicrobiae bacterium]